MYGRRLHHRQADSSATSGGDLDYGTVTVLPHNLEEFSHLDYGVVGPHDTNTGGGGYRVANAAAYGGVLDYGSDMVDEGLEEEEEEEEGGRVVVSDVSSSTLPIFNPSLRGSMASLNSKKKNITQV